MSKEEADTLIMSARNIVYKDWEMRYGKKQNWQYLWSKKVDKKYEIAKTQGTNSRVIEKKQINFLAKVLFKNKATLSKKVVHYQEIHYKKFSSKTFK